MNEHEKARAWKNGDPSADHPAGTIEVAPKAKVGLRVAVLAGLTTGVGLAYNMIMAGPPTTSPDTTATVSSYML